jgi:hypothetical protein
MADVPTPIYQFTQPEVGGSDDTWGDKLNANWVKIDGLLQSAGLTETGFFGATTTNLGTGLRIAAGSSILEFRETDITLPGGLYRWQANVGLIRLVANTAAAGDFSTNVELMTASSTAIGLNVDATFSSSIKFGSTTFPGDAATSGAQLQADSFNIKPRSGLAGTGTCIVQSWNGAATFQTLRNGAVQNSTGVISAISDAATKTDVTDATPKLADLNRLRVVNYTSTLQPDAGKLLGFVAQEVQEVFPSLVEANVIEDEDGNVTGEGPLAVKWSILVPALVKAVQELTDRLETLEGGGSRARV